METPTEPGVSRWDPKAYGNQRVKSLFSNGALCSKTSNDLFQLILVQLQNFFKNLAMCNCARVYILECGCNMGGELVQT